MEPVYEVHGLCKYYGKKAALDGVDFTVEPGKLVLYQCRRCRCRP